MKKIILTIILAILVLSINSTSALAYSYYQSPGGRVVYTNVYTGSYYRGGLGSVYYNNRYVGPAGGYGSIRQNSYGMYKPVNGGFTYMPWQYTQRLYGSYSGYGYRSSAWEVYNERDDY